ncbi:MAG: class I SAM-dependent methyltransferase [Crocinitomicaceae bacterium]|nr:class I SAM-dependent methyltransferase [Crocinitomicaceae bacterium]
MDAVNLDVNQSFDGIYSNKVLHHLNDEDLKTSIQRQHEILDPSGVVCHSFWKGTGDEIFKGMFVNYHTQDEIRSLFESTFELLLLEEYAEFDESDSILLIARKK